MGRVASGAAVLSLLLTALAPAHAAPPNKLEIVVYADRDDDDDDGVPDGEQLLPSGRSAKDVRFVEATRGRKLRAIEGGSVRVVTAKRALGAAALVKPLDAPRFGLQGMGAGRAKVDLTDVVVDVSVLEVWALDGRGERVDLTRSHASISRELPDALASSGPPPADADALSWVVAGPVGMLPSSVSLVSTRPGGEPLDQLETVPIAVVRCPEAAGAGLECRQTPPIRATSDLIDRSHPESSERSLRAEVGGRIALLVDGQKAQAIRVGGPRRSAIGAIDRYRGRLRVRLVRLAPGGSPPVGGDDASALSLAREEVRTAGALWGQCGIHFGWGPDVDVAIVDPPPAELLAIGCDLGLPASGGEIGFRAGTKTFKLQTSAGQTPTEVANAIAAQLKKSGLRAIVSANARIAQGALRTVDVIVKKPDGSPLPLLPLDTELSTDPTLNVCLGEVDLADGLTHFSDFDAASGTVEERSLIKAYDDGDPATIEVFIVPSFARTGRIGESFIYAQGSSVRNAVIIDRAGVRAGARSYALAHELGHILLDMPGHPDDFGVDQPSSLMDADAADATIFGPRRLSVGDCERALRQSGPTAPVPLLSPWPLTGSPVASKPVAR